MPAADPAQQARDPLRMTKHIVDNCECRHASTWREARDELDALAARLHAAEEALREIAHDEPPAGVWDFNVASSGVEWAGKIARAYFAAVQPGGDTEGEA